jgi:hypothetical protein
VELGWLFAGWVGCFAGVWFEKMNSGYGVFVGLGAGDCFFRIDVVVLVVVGWFVVSLFLFLVSPFCLWFPFFCFLFPLLICVCLCLFCGCGVCFGVVLLFGGCFLCFCGCGGWFGVFWFVFLVVFG